VASSATYRFKPDNAGLDRLLHDPNGPVGQWLTRLGNRAASYSKMHANIDTGLMRSMIEFRLEVQGGQLVGIVAARTNYSLYVHANNPFLLDGLRDALG
jgi:hypothetical protein